ncbi:portal protein [Gluconobacter cerinus]|uniref:portal protein n=1 Tax=Gluconobacter cerinus TaxID=38307 RepID=UPI003AB2532F
MSARLPETNDVLREVQERFEAARDFEAQWRKHALEDLRFFHADAYNHAQWDSAVYQARSGTFGGSPRPCLTINKTQQHVFQIENDARQSQMGMKVNATGFGSNEKAADVIEGIIRHIEYQSNAQQNAYNCAIQGQVRQGMGWVHVVTDYVRGQDSFDQDFFIKSVPDPRSVYSDPNTQEPDHSDMQWAMIVEEMPRAEFERLYPGHEDIKGAPLSIAAEGNERADISERDTVRVFRYYRRNEDKDTLWAVPNAQTGAMQAMRQSEMPDEMVAMCREMQLQSRPITRPHVEFFLIAGNDVISSGLTVFRHIPLVPFVGVESVIDGRLDRCGLVRSLIDPQRMFNYSASAFVESIATQTKSPWLVDERSIEGYENQWANANTSNQAWLPYRSIDPDDPTMPLAPPQRLDPPTGSTGHMQVLQANPAIMGQIGDLFFKAADFPLADEIADRLKPASDDPRLGQAQQTIQQLQAQLQQVTQQLKDKQADLSLKAQGQQHDAAADLLKEETDRYKAETDRMAAIGSTDPEALRVLVHQLVQDALSNGTPSPSDGAMPAMQDGPPGSLPRLPSSNPPGGEIHAPNPVTGAVDA